MQHLEGDIQLQIPDIDVLHDENLTPEILSQDSELVEQLEEVVMSWEQHITKVIESFLSKVSDHNQ